MKKLLKTLDAHCQILIVLSSIRLISSCKEIGKLRSFIVQTLKVKEKEFIWIKMYFDSSLICNHGNDSLIFLFKRHSIIHFRFRRYSDLTKIVILDRQFSAQMSSALSLIRKDSNYFLKTKLETLNLRLQIQTYISKETQNQSI